MNYYCLIAGLPDLQLEDSKAITTLLNLKSEMLEQLSPSDAELLKILFAKFDNENWLKFIANKDSLLNPLGNLKSTDFEELMSMMQELEKPKDARLLSYIQIFYQNNNDENFLTDGISKEDYLSSMYYEFAMQSTNKFLNSWFEFNLNINNILSAYACRKHKLEMRHFILGNNEVAQTIRSSNARDFGLTGLFDQLDVVLRITEESDLLEREKKIDALKWTWLDENTFFNYFSVERVLAYILKAEMIERWKALSVEKGTQIFRELLGNLKEGVTFEE